MPAALGQKGAPGRRRPQQSEGCGTVAAALAGRLESVSFTQSVCGLLGADQGPGPWHTHCSLERGQLVLSSSSFPRASERLLIQRPTFCPFAALDQQPGVSRPELPTNRGVDLGVAVILQSSDQTVLLTQWPRILHISPNIWVPPGTGLWGLPELWEECGLQLPQKQFSCVLLGLWESAYPPRLNWGLPKYHHLILLVLVISQESQQQLQARIQVNPNEVSAFVAGTRCSRGCGCHRGWDKDTQTSLPGTTTLSVVEVKFTWTPVQQRKDGCL